MRADIFNPSGHPQADALYRASMALIALALAALLLWLFWPEIEAAAARIYRTARDYRRARKSAKAGAL